ncbi:MAG: Fic family protein [Ruminiclostridium sp.]|nr:Fic family protein [Ruminiclostridium sp.]
MPDRYGYDFAHDTKYCAPGSTILKNKLGITDEERLRSAEREITAMWLLRLKAEPVKGRFDLAHLCAIHRRMFSDIYPWAGKCRTVDISKGNFFCRSIFIEEYARELFGRLAEENWLIYTEKETVPEKLAYYLSEINVLHPFREGNGRTQRLFIEYLGSVAGFHVDFSGVESEEMVLASADAFAKDYGRLNAMFSRICRPTRDGAQERAIKLFFGARSEQLKKFRENSR